MIFKLINEINNIIILGQLIWLQYQQYLNYLYIYYHLLCIKYGLYFLIELFYYPIIQKMKQKRQVSQNTYNRFKQLQLQQCIPAYVSFKNDYLKVFGKQRIEQIKQVYPHGISGRSRANIIVVDRIGNIRVQDLSRVFEEDEFVTYTNQRLLELSQNKLRQQQKVIWVIDLSGKIMQLASKKILECLQKIIKNAQRYFPNMLNKLIFFNTPMLFDTIWSKINLFLSQNTLNKIYMIGQQIEQLHQIIDREALPQFLGGTVTEQQWLYQFNNQKNSDNNDQSSQQQVDLSYLKQALGGLKIAGNSQQSVSQTPLNTQADDK